LKILYWLITRSIYLIGSFVTFLALLVTDPVAAFIAVIELLTNIFDDIITYIVKLFHSIANKFENWKGDKIIRRPNSWERVEPSYINSPVEATGVTEDNNHYIKYIIYGLIAGGIIIVIYYYYNNNDGASAPNLGGYLDSLNNYFNSWKDSIKNW